VERTVKLLKFLAEHPRERYSLSDLSRLLDFNKATCHAMLLELVDEGMLIRRPTDKTYMLGPALVALGTAAAQDAHEALEAARAEMAAIHAESDVSCVAVGRVGTEMVIMGRRDVDRPLFGYLPVGNRSPLVPPYGKDFLAWAPEEEVEAWLDRAEPALSDEEREGYYQDLERVRITGYHATTLPQATMLARMMRLLDGLPGAAELRNAVAQTARRHGEDIVVPLEEAPAAVLAVRAPIFGPSGQVVLTLSIGQFAGGSTGTDVRRHAERLLVGTRRVTEALRGAEPFPRWARPVSAGGRLSGLVGSG
jgi:DNA-binding IclR family transcriptional regulator